MAVYCKEKTEYLKIAVNSMINQSYPPAEIVIVEDGPLSDELYRALEDFEKVYPLIRRIPINTNRGLGLALAEGVKQCKNEWIARMDTDDYSKPERIEKQIKFLLSHPEVDIIGCSVCEFENEIDRLSTYRKTPERHEEIVKFSKKRTPFVHPTVLLKKSKVLQCGNYRNRKYVEDYDLFIRLLINGSIGYNISDSLVYVRTNPYVYARRGGIAYLKNMLSFNLEYYILKWFNFRQFIFRSGANIVVSLLPNVLRNLTYKTFLRKSLDNSVITKKCH
jgi:glycosyltransferase involved in cell wall biosynthesis